MLALYGVEETRGMPCVTREVPTELRPRVVSHAQVTNCLLSLAMLPLVLSRTM